MFPPPQRQTLGFGRTALANVNSPLLRPSTISGRSIEDPSRRGFWKALLNQTEDPAWAHPVSRLGSVASAHAIFLERYWLQLPEHLLVAYQLGYALEDHGFGRLLRTDDAVRVRR